MAPLYSLYNYDDMKRNPQGKGATLLRMLARTEPDIFGAALAYVALSSRFGNPQGTQDEISGLFVRMDGNKLHTVAIIRNEHLDRIYTLPSFRGRGYALAMLKHLYAVSLIGNLSFKSPVDPIVLPLFLKAGWTLWRENTPNQDGTLTMVSNRAVYRENSLADFSFWGNMVCDFSTFPVLA